MAGMVGEFMSSTQSKMFRDRILAQIAQAKEGADPDPNSEDSMEKFLGLKTAEELEEFIYDHAKGNRDEYLSLTADMLLSLRQCRGRPGQGRENLIAAGPDMANGATPNGDHKEEQTSS